MRLKWSRRKSIITGTLIAGLIAYYFSLPSSLFEDPYSTVLEDKTGNLLSASIAADGQWRFPELKKTPDKFATALITFEDKRFESHPGVDILSFCRAFRQNLKAKKIVSGGSTITMQVIRLSRKGKARSFLEKIIEMILATRLEFSSSKKEILSLYSSHAPFGGNVVGLEAACWRYFDRSPESLSWGEAALLAVLPNSPALIHPGKNRDQLKLKRDRLLDKLRHTHVLDDVTCDLAKSEPIPDEPHLLPNAARHLLTRMKKDGYGQQKLRSTVDGHLQKTLQEILAGHHDRLAANQVFNASAIVLDISTGDVLAYAGNVDNKQAGHGDDVDAGSAPRSTGSILKPFLFAAMLDEGKMLSKTLMPDVPTQISGFAPKNFNKEYDGAVHADRALIRSLNVPAVHMLKEYRYEKFHTLLKNMGMSTLQADADHYGLTLILGGAEGTLWEITGLYASMARTLNNFFTHPGKNKYDLDDFHAPRYVHLTKDAAAKKFPLQETSWLSAASVYLTFEALKEVYRPGEETGWRYFSSSKKIAWKTGTSFGFRDGWAIGVTPEYAVGVWVGNADGEGRPGLTGTDAAAPVMFDIFSRLPGKAWFEKPLLEMERVPVCSKSGYKLSELCEEADTIYCVKSGAGTGVCPYHKKIHLSADQKFQVNSACESLADVKHVAWFVLPAVQEYYFKSRNLSYKSLPPYRKDCQTSGALPSMDLIYPKQHSRLFIPRDIDGKPGSSIFELAHRDPNVTVFWHLDGEYLGSTRKVHHFGVNPREGAHTLTIIDENGEQLVRDFIVLSKM